jgi:hypothetical protein
MEKFKGLVGWQTDPDLLQNDWVVAVILFWFLLAIPDFFPC